MTFIIKNNLTKNKTNRSLARLNFIRQAKTTILLFPMNADEHILENFLLANYHITLKHACLLLLKVAKININNGEEIIVSFLDKKYDNLATLITYGNLGLRGSKILQKAFS